MQAEDLVSCPGVLSFELTPGEQPRRLSLERDEADALAGFIAADLRELLPDAAKGKLAVVGAHFDSVELLRPGFPVFATLSELAAHKEGEVLAFGSRDGHMPAEPLVPDPAFQGGALRSIPWTLLASPELVKTLGPDMENELVGRGEIGERTGDYLMRTLGMRLEHARYFSHHDLMAMVDVHYQHANLLALWTLIEVALLSPASEEQETSAHGLGWRFAANHAIAQTPGQWLEAQGDTHAAERAHDLAGVVFELRQYLALLDAHRIPVDFERGDYLDSRMAVIETLAEPDPACGDVTLHAHEAPGLGVIAVTAAQQQADAPRILANAWITGRDVSSVYRQLADHYGCDSHPAYLGKVVLGTDSRLGIPAATVH